MSRGQKLGVLTGTVALMASSLALLSAPAGAATPAAAMCPNAYCYSGTSVCEYVYRSYCELNPILPCDNHVC